MLAETNYVRLDEPKSAQLDQQNLIKKLVKEQAETETLIKIFQDFAGLDESDDVHVKVTHKNNVCVALKCERRLRCKCNLIVDITVLKY